jgi:teichuronic acid biosynthesis glycosyltransferase TuaH
MQADGVNAKFLPNGCDLATMGQTPLHGETYGLPAPVAVYLGLLNDRTDLALLEAVAATGQSLLIVGPRQESFQPQRFAALCARPNVVAVGPVPFATLPEVLAGTAVGLVPYADTPFNRASFPLKALEYLAAGRPVVSTPLPAIRWLDSEHITLAADPTAFAAATVRAGRNPMTPNAAAARRQFAAAHTWERRADTAAGWLGLNPHAARRAAGAQTASPPSSLARQP